MDARELVILLLGLAIVAVVLRGLYVAIQARRGQIRLAIDKNIPQDVDLEALELAELPGGGARTVDRSLEQVNLQNSALDSAQARAQALDLGEGAEDEEQVPVLMDAVELGELRSASSDSDNTSEELPLQDSHAEFTPVSSPSADDDGLVAADNSESTDWDEPENYLEEEDFESTAESLIEPTISELGFEDDFETEEITQPVERENEASYEETAEQAQDLLQAVAPDYEEDGSDYDETDGEIEREQVSENSYAQESHEISENADYNDDFLDQEAGEIEQEQDQGEEPAPGFDAEKSLDDFSMTAGERIGYQPQAEENAQIVVNDEIEQTGLFDEPEELAETPDQPKRKSLFSFFGRKPKAVKSENADAENYAEGIDEELDDVLLEPVQIELPEAEEDYLADDVYEDDTAGLTQDYAPEQQDEEVEIEAVDELQAVRTSNEPESTPQQAELSQPSEVIVINVMAKQGRVFAGNDLLHILITAGLKFGDMNIFHKRLSNEANGPILFSIANMLNPGTFDLNNMEEFTTMGVSFFMALPTAINNLDAFEQMLDVAQQIRGALDGELKDDHRNGMTAQTTEHYRQRIRDFELMRLKAAGARG